MMAAAAQVAPLGPRTLLLVGRPVPERSTQEVTVAQADRILGIVPVALVPEGQVFISR